MILRQSPWFQDLFGFIEGPSFARNRDAFSISGDGFLLCPSAPPHGQRLYVGPFETPQLSELRVRCRGSCDTGLGGLRFEHLPDPVGVQALIANPANAGAVFQAASQFNCLEMTGPGVSPARGVTDYASDPTQGPKCALACPAGTVFRNYLWRGKGQGKKQIDCLKDVGDLVGNHEGKFWRMQNGYALPTSVDSLRQLGTRLAADPDLKEQAEAALRVGVHWDTSVKPPATHTVAQVYASAMPVAYAKKASSADWEPIASVVLRAAYEATLAVAACKAQQEQGRVRVFLTCLGGGAFGNPDQWIAAAIQHALHVHRDSPLDVYLVHYGTCVKSIFAELLGSAEPISAAAPPAGNTAQLEAKLRAFCVQHNRLKVADVRMLARKYVGNESVLNQKLRAKYKADLTEHNATSRTANGMGTDTASSAGTWCKELNAGTHHEVAALNGGFTTAAGRGRAPGLVSVCPHRSSPQSASALQLRPQRLDEVDSMARQDHASFASEARRWLPWTCPSCTFVNEQFVSLCEVCDAPNLRARQQQTVVAPANADVGGLLEQVLEEDREQDPYNIARI